MDATATTSPDLTQLDGKIKNADRLVKLALIVLAVAVAVLVIDQGIKRRIVAEAEKALKLLAEAQRIMNVSEAESGRPEPAGEASASPGDSEHADHGVDDAAGTSADPVPDAGNGLGPEASRVSRPFGGPRGDG